MALNANLKRWLDLQLNSSESRLVGWWGGGSVEEKCLCPRKTKTRAGENCDARRDGQGRARRLRLVALRVGVGVKFAAGLKWPHN